MSKHPEVLWAQRSSSVVSEKNIISLTINIPNIIKDSLEYVLTSTSLSFKAQASTSSGSIESYAFDLAFFAEIDPEHSTKRLSPRSFFATLRKKESKSEYWPRLTKDKAKTAFIKTDFSKWVDEDEQDGNTTGLDEDGFGDGGNFSGMGMDKDFDFSKLGSNLGGAGLPAMTGDDPAGSDSDEDGLPPLEDAEPAK